MNKTLNALRRHWFNLRTVVGRWPMHRKVGVIVAIVAVAGLVWIDHTNSHSPDPAASPQASTSATPTDDEDTSSEDTATGTVEAPSNLPVPDASVDAARGTAERFATNFGSPNGNFDDWYARISPDISLQLREQYRLTDIRNVAQNTVTKVLGPLNQLPGTMAFDITYSDTSRIEIRVEMGVEGWQVINVLPLQDNPVPAPAPAPVPAPPAGQ